MKDIIITLLGIVALLFAMFFSFGLGVEAESLNGTEEMKAVGLYGAIIFAILTVILLRN